HFQGPDRSNATVETAELILVGWGWLESIPLIPDGDTVRLDFEKLEAQSPEKFRNLEKAQVYVRAANLASIQSEPFVWPRSTGVGTAIDFRDGRSVTIRIGADQELTMMMRRPEPRRIRLVDIDGKPIAGLKVSVYRFETSENHCGFLRGEELKVSSTDTDGTLTVPDGDFNYAFKL